MPKGKNETIETKQKIIIPQSEDNKTDQELIDNFLSHSDKEYKQMGKEIEEAEKKREEKEKRRKKEEKIAKLKGNTDAILNDLKENHVKIEENAEMMGYKGEKVHIELPQVGNFEGFKFDYFVSDDKIFKKDFESNPKLEKKSYSMNNIGKLLQAMNKYMAELGGIHDGNMDYENELKLWKNRKHNCKAGDCLKAITGLNKGYGSYWLSDKDVEGKESRAERCCNGEHCFFYPESGDYAWEILLLKLS